MNIEFAEQLKPEFGQFHFTKALQIAGSEIRKIPTTEFHAVLHYTFADQVESLTNWIDDFYKEISKNIKVKALYFEMNEFDINTSLWYIDGIAYGKDGGLNLNDMEWLSDCKRDTMTSTEFVLTGFETIQSAFETIDEKKEHAEWTEDMQAARDWCEQIVIAEFMQLMRNAHLNAKDRKLEWATIPLYFTEHGYDLILKSDH